MSANRLQQRTRLEQIVSRISRLAALPNNVTRILQLIEQPNTGAEAIGREIAKDQSLAAEVLKLANSGFYGFVHRISCIQHATVLLGFNATRDLVISTSAAKLLERSMPGLYTHSLACARATFTLSGALGFPDLANISTAGLLHDIGKVILVEHFKPYYEQIAALVKEKSLLIKDAEKQILGVTHAELGKWLLQKWRLPPETILPVANHHRLGGNPEFRRRSAAVHLADIIVRAEGFGYAGDDGLPVLDPLALQWLDLTPKDLQPLIDEIVDNLSDLPRQPGEV
jgi:putative nucleotidyltransferase with HDIG domain